MVTIRVKSLGLKFWRVRRVGSMPRQCDNFQTRSWRASSRAWSCLGVVVTGKGPAGQVIKERAPSIGGRGGGKADMAEGGGNQPENLSAALQKSYEVVERLMS